MKKYIMLALFIVATAASISADPQKAQALKAAHESLIIAAKQGNCEQIVAALAQGADVNCEDDPFTANTPLILAAMFGQKNAVNLLLENDAKIDSANKQGTTALHAAARYGHDDVIEILLSSEEALINAKDNASKTPLIITAERGHLMATILLLGHGADHTVTVNGEAPWYLALKNEHFDVLNTLLAHDNAIKAINS